MHSLPTNSCPFDETLNVRLARARELIRRGEIDAAQFDTRNAGITPEGLYQRLEAGIPEQEDCVVSLLGKGARSRAKSAHFRRESLIVFFQFPFSTSGDRFDNGHRPVRRRFENSQRPVWGRHRLLRQWAQARERGAVGRAQRSGAPHPLEAASQLAEIPITLRGLPEEFGVSHQSVRRQSTMIKVSSTSFARGMCQPSAPISSRR
jgi:hypothetical protein